MPIFKGGGAKLETGLDDGNPLPLKNSQPGARGTNKEI